MVDIHFSDFFEVTTSAISEYGAFNISLIRDLPLFIDPFLLFNSDDVVYRQLHDDIIRYLKFLRDESSPGLVEEGLLRAWFYFPEVKQSWLGYSKTGNSGRGLGRSFAVALRANLSMLFRSIGEETVTKGTHFEKLTLFDSGVGRDMISDFTTNLIKHYLCEYTQMFAQEHLKPDYVRQVSVDRVRFNYTTKTWQSDIFELPWYANDYVLLAPVNMLSRLDTWINRSDLISNFHIVAKSMPDQQLVAQINSYLRQAIDPKAPAKAKRKQREQAIEELLRRHPAIIDYYIKHKEDTGDEAHELSEERVEEIINLFVTSISHFSKLLAQNTEFYVTPENTYAETHKRIKYLKDFIEYKGGHKWFWVDDKPVRTEADIQLLFKLVWYGSPSEPSSEVNDGRGPVDFKISRGSKDKTLVEFKIGSNSQLKRNLENQTDIYENASDAKTSIKVIVYFDKSQEARVKRILRELSMQNERDVVLIDARADNKPSGSKA